MCEFKSAIVLRDESLKGGFKLLMSPWTESHSELITLHNLKDGARLAFARVEFKPESLDEAYLIDSYKLTIDEEHTPDWFDDIMKEAVTERMRAYIKSIIVEGNVALLVGGQYIIAPGAKVKCAHSMVINAMCGGTLNAMCGGTLNEMRGGTLNEMWGGTLNKTWGGTLNEMRGGTLNEMRGDGVIKTISQYFNGLLGTITGKIVNDERKQPK